MADRPLPPVVRLRWWTGLTLAVQPLPGDAAVRHRLVCPGPLGGDGRGLARGVRQPRQAPDDLLRLQDWARDLALRAATSGIGRSLRQAERRIKGWTGLPMRELRSHGRAEKAFYRAFERFDAAARWTDVAADAGFADQSHLCRETRRVTGFSPAELRSRIANDEGFWLHRIWARRAAPASAA